MSTDTLEHMPAPRRAGYIRELKRVARRCLIISCPLESDDGRTEAERCNLALVGEIQGRSARIPGWLVEHTKGSYPTSAEILEQLPGASVEYLQNSDGWVRFQKMYLRPFAWIIAGYWYLLVLQRGDGQPPYYRGTFRWRKPSSLENEDGCSRCISLKYLPQRHSLTS